MTAPDKGRRWTIHVCNKCGDQHGPFSRFSSCVVEFDPAGDTLAGTQPVEVVAVDALLSDEAVADACSEMHDRLPDGCSMSIARAGLTAAVDALTGTQPPQEPR